MTKHNWFLSYKNKQVLVIIFDTNKNLNKWIREKYKNKRINLIGGCSQFYIDNNQKIVTVTLSLDHIGSGIIAHEMVHASSFLLSLQNKKLTRRLEEKLAMMVDTFCSAFWKKWYRYAEKDTNNCPRS